MELIRFVSSILGKIFTSHLKEEIQSADEALENSSPNQMPDNGMSLFTSALMHFFESLDFASQLQQADNTISTNGLNYNRGF